MKKIIFLISICMLVSQFSWGEDRNLILRPEDQNVQNEQLTASLQQNKSQQSPLSEIPDDPYGMDEMFKLENDKEVLISAFSKSEKARIQKIFSNQDENLKFKKMFVKNVFSFLHAKDGRCELSFITSLIKEMDAKKIHSRDYIVDQFKMLRVNNSIDDILYEILEQLTIDYFEMKSYDYSRIPSRNIFKNYKKKEEEDIDLEKTFSEFKSSSVEKDSCLYREFFKVRESVSDFKDSRNEKNQKIKDYAFIAWDKNIISTEAYNQIKFLSTKSTINKRNIWLNDYLKVIFSAKNKMIPFKRKYKVINLEDENIFSSEKVKRFSTLTRRKILYSKYDENQIVLMAQVMRKASQRMGVDPDTETETPYLIQNFKVHKQSGQTESISQRIELDTQSQFNLARRLLRKDMVSLQMMKSFQQVKITYEDLVMASLETGYISLDDIEYVVRYDNLWNPEVSKSERMLHLSFKIAGYGTFFLPPPFNVTAALALSIVEGIVDSKRIDGATNDNPNTFIE